MLEVSLGTVLVSSECIVCTTCLILYHEVYYRLNKNILLRTFLIGSGMRKHICAIFKMYWLFFAMFSPA
jgi:hypothetical protein